MIFVVLGWILFGYSPIHNKDNNKFPGVAQYYFYTFLALNNVEEVTIMK